MAFEATINDDTLYPVITLKDTATNTFAELFTFGALLNKFCIARNGTSINVIEGYERVEDARINLTPFFKSAKLAPFVCRVKNAQYNFDHTDYTLSKYADGDNALHGLIYDQVFSIIAISDGDEQASVTMETTYNAPGEGYPFPFRCAVNYTLKANASLQITTTITNLHQQPIPVADGWHPYFTLGDTVNDYNLQFSSTDLLEFDYKLIPTGKLIPYTEFAHSKSFGTTWFDNCFTVNFNVGQPIVKMSNPNTGIQIEIHSDQSYPYLQFFTPAHRKSIAIENLSAAPDAFNNGLGLQLLQPEESASFQTTYLISSL